MTMDDTHPSIIYKPADSWHAQSTICTACEDPPGLRPGAYLSTYHEGIHALPAPHIWLADVGIRGRKAESNSGIVPRSPGLVDTNVTAEFHFTGTAVYLYGIQATPSYIAGETQPMNMNISFTLDDYHHASFVMGHGSKSTNAHDINVFSCTELSEKPHILRVSVEPGSAFLFDYMVYTRTAAKPANGTISDMSMTSMAPDIPTPSEATSTTKRHNIATFAGAIGGSVGVLAVVSLALAFSIIRRRRGYERRERGSLHTEASEDSPRMIGPAPFVPRFFPGTQLPADPPPYHESLAIASSLSMPGSASDLSIISSSESGMSGHSDMLLHNSNHVAVSPVSTGMSSTSPYGMPRRQGRSYADIPPTSPPPPLDDLLVPPPPFGFVVALRPPGDLMGVETAVSPSAAEDPRPPTTPTSPP